MTDKHKIFKISYITLFSFVLFSCYIQNDNKEIILNIEKMINDEEYIDALKFIESLPLKIVDNKIRLYKVIILNRIDFDENKDQIHLIIRKLGKDRSYMVLYLYGKVLKENMDYQKSFYMLNEALDVYENSIEKKSYWENPYYELAEISYKIGKYKLALDYSNKFLKISPHDPIILYLHSNILLKLNRITESLSYFSQAKKIDSSCLNYQEEYIDNLIFAKDYIKALNLLKDILNIRYDISWVYYKLSLVNIILANYSEAEAILVMYEDIFGFDIEVLKYRGVIKYFEGDINKSLDFIEDYYAKKKFFKIILVFDKKKWIEKKMQSDPVFCLIF